MSEELKLVTSFDELRAGMDVIDIDCRPCGHVCRRKTMKPFTTAEGERAWQVEDCSPQLPGIPFVGEKCVKAHRLYRVIDGLESESTTTTSKKVTMRP